MDHENTITLDAFLTALSRLGDPLPVELKKQLNAIAQGFPDTIRKLPGLVDQYAPLEEQYEMSLDAMPSDGERLKFAEPQTLEPPTSEAESSQDLELPESTVSWDEVERQVGTYFTNMALELMEGVKIPNDVTQKTFEDTDAGKNLVRCHSVDELFEQIGI